MLVDQVHAVGPFGDDVGGPELTHHPQEREQLALSHAWRGGTRFARELTAGEFESCLDGLRRAQGRRRLSGPAGRVSQDDRWCRSRERPGVPGDGPRPFESTLDGVAHGPTDCPLVAKTDLGLGRVDVHIHLVIGDADVDGRDGEAAAGQLRLVGIDHRENQRTALHPAAVHEHRDGAAVAPVDW